MNREKLENQSLTKTVEFFEVNEKHSPNAVEMGKMKDWIAKENTGFLLQLIDMKVLDMSGHNV